jgi:hypothetical protein
MTQYRLYCFDRFHRLARWRALTCASDEDALAQAACLLGEYFTVEIVEGVRVIGTLTAMEQGYSPENHDHCGNELSAQRGRHLRVQVAERPPAIARRWPLVG